MRRVSMVSFLIEYPTVYIGAFQRRTHILIERGDKFGG